MPKAVEIYDTTLRDGAQLEGISLTGDDKLRIAEQLDRLGVHYIEGGWPGANPKDVEFFERAQDELDLQRSKLVAFGSTRRVGGDASADLTLANLLEAGTDVVCIVGKASASESTSKVPSALTAQGSTPSHAVLAGVSGEPHARLAVETSGETFYGNGTGGFHTGVRQHIAGKDQWDPPAIGPGDRATTTLARDASRTTASAPSPSSGSSSAFA